MTLTYAVTFENDTGLPETVRGTVTGSNEGTCVRRALQDAKKQVKHFHWSSIVVVVEKPRVKK